MIARVSVNLLLSPSDFGSGRKCRGTYTMPIYTNISQLCRPDHTAARTDMIKTEGAIWMTWVGPLKGLQWSLVLAQRWPWVALRQKIREDHARWSQFETARWVGGGSSWPAGMRLEA